MKGPPRVAMADRQRWRSAGLGCGDTAPWAARGMVLGSKYVQVPVRFLDEPGYLDRANRPTVVRILSRLNLELGDPDVATEPMSTREIKRLVTAKFRRLRENRGE